MTIFILSIAAVGFLVSLILLVRQLLPKDKPADQVFKDLGKKGQDQYAKTFKKGQEYVAKTSKAVLVAEAFSDVVVLPNSFGGRLRGLIGQLRNSVDSADAFVKNPDIFKMLSLVSPASADAYGQTSDNYTFIITEDVDEPFQVNQEIVQVANKIVAEQIFDEDKARALFDWCVKNIPYGTTGWKKHQRSMRHAKEIFEDKEGVCAEMAILYIAMARAVGLEANYARLQGHACAAVKLNGKYTGVELSGGLNSA